MADHACQLPDQPPAGTRSWRCPTCFTRYAWSKRMVGGTSYEGWAPMRDDMETRRMRSDAEFNRSRTWAVAFGLPALLIVAGLVVWIVLRATS